MMPESPEHNPPDARPRFAERLCAFLDELSDLADVHDVGLSGDGTLHDVHSTERARFRWDSQADRRDLSFGEPH